MGKTGESRRRKAKGPAAQAVGSQLHLRGDHDLLLNSSGLCVVVRKALFDAKFIKERKDNKAKPAKAGGAKLKGLTPPRVGSQLH